MTSNATEAEAGLAIIVLESAIDAARNSNQAGENAVVRAAAVLLPIDRSRRRFQMQDWTVGEKAIYDAVQAVETMGGHPRLTKVVNMLDDALYELGLWVQDDAPKSDSDPASHARKDA